MPWLQVLETRMDPEANQSDDPKRTVFIRPLKPAEKAVVFVALVFLFSLASGFEYRWRRTAITFVLGAVIALWVRPEPVGVLCSMSYHGYAILLGCLMMIWAMVMTLLLRDTRPKPSQQTHSIEHSIQYRDSSALPLWKLKVER